MKSVIERNNVQRMGVKSENTFSIKATGKAFRILSDGLYSDKITAIIRELSCNAYDAHVEAGTLDKPFTLHLPTKFEPFFSLRDYGIGLSHEDVMQVYTTYFESTKTDSNDYIGQLGLGSKSPYSYVDSFTIVSFFNGVKRTYSAFMNEEGIPSIALMDESETDEVNGVQVSFAVGDSDFYSFSSRIPNVFRYFKMKPEITGSKDFAIEKVEYGLEGNGWGIRKNDNGYRDHGSRAIMGNVSYPLTDLDSEKITKEENSLIRSNIDIHFEIGELEVAASRENLSFNKITIANIQMRLGMLVKEVSAKVSKELNDCPTLFDARLRAIELSNGVYSELKSIFNLKNILYKGEEVYDGISSSIVAIPKDLQDELDIDLFSEGVRTRRRNRYSSYDDAETVINRINRPNGISIKRGGTKFFLRDLNVGSHVRCKQVINETDINHVYLISPENMDAVNKLMKLLGYEGKVEPISSIERIKVKGRTLGYNPMNAKKVLIYNNDKTSHDRNDVKSYWVNDKVNSEAGGIFLKMSRYKVNGGDIPCDYVERFFSALDSIGVDTTGIQLIGVKESKWYEFDKDSSWKTLQEYAQGKFKEYLEANSIMEHIDKYNAYQSVFLNSYGNRIARLIESNIEVFSSNDNTVLQECIDTAKDWQESYEVVNKVSSIASSLYYGLHKDSSTEKAEKLKDDTIEKLNLVSSTYPMLEIVAGSYNYDNTVVKGYIDLVDESNKEKKIV